MQKLWMLSVVFLFTLSACKNLDDKRYVQLSHDDSKPYERRIKLFTLSPEEAYRKMEKKYPSVRFLDILAVIQDYYFFGSPSKHKYTLLYGYLVNGYTGEIIKIKTKIYIHDGMELDLDEIISKRKSVE